ncbi:hypothetical protein G6F24_015374 [Rhizopus arrhizus]|nr:hypothetical protein G6F24_015374 [Rhizopus arrhizus]
MACRRTRRPRTVGGSGALRVGADVLKKLLPHATVALSNPSWENHRAVFSAAGFEVVDYTYFDPTTHGVDFDGMLADLTQWYAQVGLPTTLRELGAADTPGDADLTLAAELTLKARHAANFDRELDVATLADALRRHA